MNLKERIKNLSEENFREVVAIRRAIHECPELGYEEEKTAGLVCKKLTEYNIPFVKGIAKTGVVALLQGKNPDKKCVALRADMDALPILETSDIPYKSKNEGKMHACGHDVHTANLLGTAKILSALRNEFEGTIKFIFQPSEEKMPSGAAAMITEGVLENPKPEAIFGIHVSPEIQIGKVGFRSGPFMASADEIYLKVIGKGGHAARPQEVINPLFTVAKIISAFERVTDLNKPVLLSFGHIEGKGATNIIPDSIYIEGTLRCFDETLRNEMHSFIQKTIEKICEENRCSCDLNIMKGYPVLVNNESLTEQTKNKAGEYLSSDKILDLPMRMGAEDFAFYSHHIPACFYRIGVGNADQGITSNIHTSTFDIDEDALKLSTGLMAFLAISTMK